MCLTHRGHNIGFWPDRIAVGDLDGREQAEQMIEHPVKLVNDTWGRRGDLA